MTDNLLGTDVVRCCVERDKAGEGADCDRPRDQEYQGHGGKEFHAWDICQQVGKEFRSWRVKG